MSAVYHGPDVFRHAKTADGSPLVQGKSVTAFAHIEGQEVGLAEVVPFLADDVLRENGGKYSKFEGR